MVLISAFTETSLRHVPSSSASSPVVCRENCQLIKWQICQGFRSGHGAQKAKIIYRQPPAKGADR